VSYSDALLDIARSDPRVLVLTAENRAAIRNVPAELGSRFIDVGIAEQTLVGVAAGLALRGRIPVVHALAAFLTMRAFEFIRTDVGLPKLPVKLVGYVPGLLSDGNGPTHQAIEDVALMRAVPNMLVFSPADEAELQAALPELIRDPRPCYVRYTSEPPRVRHLSSRALGKAEVLATGTDATILAHGILLGRAEQARCMLTDEKLSVGLVNVPWIEPLDEAAILEVALRSRRLVVVEDHLTVGGLYSAVAELVARSRVAVELSAVSLKGRWFRPGRLDDIIVREGFSAEAIALAVKRAVRAPERAFGGERVRDVL
jgi:transketolase